VHVVPEITFKICFSINKTHKNMVFPIVAISEPR
jgi:hypothetical protein